MKTYYILFPPASLYVKVTLFEGQNVIKAKKTRLVAPSVDLCRTVTFYETFSILFPCDFLQEVSCIISLCGKTRQGKSRMRLPMRL